MTLTNEQREKIKRQAWANCKMLDYPFDRGETYLANAIIDATETVCSQNDKIYTEVLMKNAVIEQLKQELSISENKIRIASETIDHLTGKLNLLSDESENRGKVIVHLKHELELERENLGYKEKEIAQLKANITEIKDDDDKIIVELLEKTDELKKSKPSDAFPNDIAKHWYQSGYDNGRLKILNEIEKWLEEENKMVPCMMSEAFIKNKLEELKGD